MSATLVKLKEVIKKLKTIGFYDSSASNILPNTFRPIEDKNEKD